MRLPILGGPHDGAHAILPTHDVVPGRPVTLGSTRYVIDWQRAGSPRLTYAGAKAA